MFATLFLGAVLAVFLTIGVVRGDAETRAAAAARRAAARPRRRCSSRAGPARRSRRRSTSLVVYAVALALITPAFGDWTPDHVVAPGLALAAAVVIVAAISVLASVYLTSTAQGIAVFMVFGAGLVAGLLGQIGDALDSRHARSGSPTSPPTRSRSRRSTSRGSSCSRSDQHGLTETRWSSSGPFGGAAGGRARAGRSGRSSTRRRRRPRGRRLQAPRPLTRSAGSARLGADDRHPLPPRALRAARRRAGRRRRRGRACGGCSRVGHRRGGERARRSRPPRRTRRSSPRSAATRTAPRGFDDAAAARIEELAAPPAGRRGRRDRARLLPRPRAARGPAPRLPGPDRDRPAGREAARDPRPRRRRDDRRRGARRDLRDPARRGGRGDRDPALLLGPARAGRRGGGAGLVLLVRRQRHLPEVGGAARGGRARSPTTCCWSRPTRRSSRPQPVRGQAEPAGERGRDRRGARRGRAGVSYAELEAIVEANAARVFGW